MSISEYGSKIGSRGVSVIRQPKWDLGIEIGKVQPSYKGAKTSPLGH
jgi:hypothetical protein